MVSAQEDPRWGCAGDPSWFCVGGSSLGLRRRILVGAAQEDPRDVIRPSVTFPQDLRLSFFPRGYPLERWMSSCALRFVTFPGPLL